MLTEKTIHVTIPITARAYSQQTTHTRTCLPSFNARGCQRLATNRRGRLARAGDGAAARERAPGRPPSAREGGGGQIFHYVDHSTCGSSTRTAKSARPCKETTPPPCP